MSDQNNDAALYSLKELKDMPSDAKPSPQIAPAAVANVKPQKKGWASDDSAGDLLAGILDDTESAALAEKKRVQANLDAQKRDEERRKAEEEERKRREQDERIRAEQDRRNKAERMRASLVRSIEGPSDEELEAKRKAEVEEARRIDMERRLAEAERARNEAERKAAEATRESQMREEQRLQAIANAPEPVRKSGFASVAMAVIGLGFIVVTIGAVGVGGFFYWQSTQAPQAQTYAKAALKATSIESPATEQGFAALRLPDVEESGGDGGAVASRRGGGNNTTTRQPAGRNPNANSKAAPGGNDKKKDKPKFNFDGGGGGGGIVF